MTTKSNERTVVTRSTGLLPSTCRSHIEKAVAVYHSTHVLVGSVGVGSTLAFTGANVMWLALAAFALIGAGAALLRLVPRREA